jgi:SAM-dependent methyltransferase
VRAHADRSRRFVFNTVVEEYVRGRPRTPLKVVEAAADAVVLPPRARVLEIGAGAGQLTETLVRAGFEVAALEPGAALRERAALVGPFAELRAEPFEDYIPSDRFDAIFSANAFHWIDPAVAYPRAADIADALVLIWDTPFIADPRLHRRVQEEVMAPRGPARRASAHS